MDGTRVDFPPKSDSKLENALDSEKASESELVGEELRLPEEKTSIDIESDNNANTTLPQLAS